MPSEDELRDFLSYDPTPHNSIDSTQVISRSRHRRLPRQIAAGAVSALAVAGIVTVAVQTTQFTSPAAVTSQGAPAGGASDEAMPAEGLLDTDLTRAPAEKINLCTGALTEVSPSLYGLQLDVAFPVGVWGGPQTETRCHFREHNQLFACTTGGGLQKQQVDFGIAQFGGSTLGQLHVGQPVADRHEIEAPLTAQFVESVDGAYVLTVFFGEVGGVGDTGVADAKFASHKLKHNYRT